jgi:hypothetical protein
MESGETGIVSVVVVDGVLIMFFVAGGIVV